MRHHNFWFYSQEGELTVKCSVYVTDFFLKTEQLIFVNKNLKEKLKYRKERLLFLNEKSLINQRPKNFYNSNNNFVEKLTPDFNIILFLVLKTL